MAASDVAKILRVPGTIVKDPTDLTTTTPWGGTVLGPTRGVYAMFSGVGFDVTAEEFGFEVVERAESGEVYAFGCFLRGMDDDALAHLFPNTAAGTTTQHRLVSSPGSVRAGHRVSDRSAKIAFVPDNADLAPCLVIYKALPTMEPGSRWALERQEEWGFPVVWLAMRDASGRTFKMGRRKDIAL